MLNYNIQLEHAP